MSIKINKDIFAALDASIQATILAAINDTNKPKRVLSEEQKAKMKAGRDAAKAKKADGTVTAHVVVASSSGSVTSEGSAKKRGPKKLADMTPEERTAHDAKVAERKAKKTAASSDTETVAEAGEVIVPQDKPKRVISEEQKAKMKAGREAAAAKKKALTSETERSPSPKAKTE
jgi:hypothetical protein